MEANKHLFKSFLESEDTLWILQTDNLLFISKEKGLLPLVTYLDDFSLQLESTTAFDQVVGNAAALLLERAHCREVWSVLGSEVAAQSLRDFGIRYHFQRTVPHILNRDGSDTCPMEKLSIGKSPEEFYEMIRAILCPPDVGMIGGWSKIS